MIWIATIDSDIANIPDNEFASVFAGGIVVMFGGLLSALAVGFILEKRNLYATVVAESYAQGGDEDFWKSLSEEEKIKAQSILQQIKSNNEGGSPPSLPTSTSLSTTETVSPITPTTPIVPDSSKTEKKQIGMFSDYGEE